MCWVDLESWGNMCAFVNSLHASLVFPLWLWLLFSGLVDMRFTVKNPLATYFCRKCSNVTIGRFSSRSTRALFFSVFLLVGFSMCFLHFFAPLWLNDKENRNVCFGQLPIISRAKHECILTQPPNAAAASKVAQIMATTSHIFDTFGLLPYFWTYEGQ